MVNFSILGLRKKWKKTCFFQKFLFFSWTVTSLHGHNDGCELVSHQIIDVGY